MDRNSFGDSTSSLVEALANLAVDYYPKNIFADVPEIERMDQLVEFIAELGDLRQAVLLVSGFSLTHRLFVKRNYSASRNPED